jgi:hypothetical protein
VRGAVVGLVAAGLLGVAVTWGSFVAGGSDSYCYLHQAERWADAFRHPRGGRLQVVEPLALEAPWPNAAATFTPVGHMASPTVPGAIAPVCPSGLSIFMAPFVLVAGRAGAFAVVPLFGVLLVVATYVTGSRFGANVGAAGAGLVAASPIVLFQVVQPMSDVPAAALWMMAIAAATGTGRRHALASGLATSAAILVRPNLLPLGIVLGLFLLLRPERSWATRLTAAMQYAGASAIGCAAVALVQWTFFGSPFSSGYGAFDDLFAAANVVPNLRLQTERLLDSHTPAIAAGLAATFVLPGPLTMLLLGLVAVNVAVYAAYIPFPEWSYLRFLLPTLPLLLILLAAVVDAVSRRWLRRLDSRLVLAAVVVLLAVVFVRDAQARQAFRLARIEARFERAGRYVGERLPQNAVVLTTWHSGSVRFYGGRRTIVWDALDPAWLDRSVDFLRARGFAPYLLFDGQEEQAFRARFAGSAYAALDWPPAAEVLGQVRIYRLADRAAYARGEMRPTEYVR